MMTVTMTVMTQMVIAIAVVRSMGVSAGSVRCIRRSSGGSSSGGSDDDYHP
jgi:hypothetical protein